MVKVAGSLQRSSDVMKLVNESMRLPEMQKTMMEMGKGSVHVQQPWRLLCAWVQTSCAHAQLVYPTLANYPCVPLIRQTPQARTAQLPQPLLPPHPCAANRDAEGGADPGDHV